MKEKNNGNKNRHWLFGLGIGTAAVFFTAAMSLAPAGMAITTSNSPAGSGVQLAAEHHPKLPVPAQTSFLQKEEAAGGDCMLTVPANPLSAQGLATPYQLSNGPNTNDCTMANAANLGAFVQATILEPGGKLLEYDPLVVTAGTAPAVAPPVPVIPAGSVVTIDTGFQGNIDFLTGPGAGAFVQGLPGSPFGQVAFANGPAFFIAAHFEGVKPPALGTSPADNMACQTVHDFSLVDQDQSDNVTTQYILTGGGQTAEQGSGAAGMLINNGSDNLLLDHFLAPALGCQGSEFAVPSLSDPETMEATQATDELLANADQKAPVALVPVNDPMTTVGADTDIIPGTPPNAGNLSIFKTDLYRAELGQPLLFSNAVGNATTYCTNLKNAGTRVAADEQLPGEINSGSPGGMPLNTFMANRYAASLTLLNCAGFGGTPSAAPSTAPSDTPSTTPSDTPSTAPSDTPSTAPSDTPSTPTPSDTPSTAPAQ